MISPGLLKMDLMYGRQNLATTGGQAIQSGMQRFESLHQKLATLPAQAGWDHCYILVSKIFGQNPGVSEFWRPNFHRMAQDAQAFCDLEVLNPLADQAQRLHEEFLRLQKKGMQLASGQLMLEACCE